MSDTITRPQSTESPVQRTMVRPTATELVEEPTGLDKETAGPRFEEPADLLNRIETGLDGFSEEDRKHIDMFIDSVTDAYLADLSSREDALGVSLRKAEQAFQAMSPEAKEHVDTDAFKNLLTRFLLTSRKAAL